MLNEINFEELLKKVMNSVQMCVECLTFIENSGNYKKRQVYKMSDEEINKKVKDLKSQFVHMNVCMIVAETILKKKDRIKLFEKILDRLDEMLKEKNKGVTNE